MSAERSGEGEPRSSPTTSKRPAVQPSAADRPTEPPPYDTEADRADRADRSDRPASDRSDRSDRPDRSVADQPFESSSKPPRAIHPPQLGGAHRFPKDPAGPAIRQRRFRRPHVRHTSVTTVWQQSEEESRQFATRFAGQLLVIGAALGTALTFLLSVQTGAFSVGWYVDVVTGAVAAAWGLVYILMPRPAPDAVLRATPAIAALLITFTLAFNHSNAVDGMLLLSWPLLFAAYLLPRRTAYWTLGIVAACLTVIFVAGTGPGRFAAWIETTTSMALTLVVILRVREQADRLKQALAEQASTDPLTGLSNRRAFDEALEREAARQRRTRAPLSLLAVDVDHFKKINDTWGHAAGDDTLAALGDLLPRLVRADDTVSRVGGEEFGVLLPDCPAPQARARADALRAEVWAASRGWSHPVTVSVGVATVPDSADALQDLVVAADMALYAAKESGRDRVRVAPLIRRRDELP
ncbi:diguanylate cyclase [Catenulispora acidiphila DSM 44928]|uniref:Diguanylate cyclase n=1 Tax=Catenulispora acidiphila (strain DSM 44928 / JCM 14897 / NBRC 102108 / NRRL B-24433 / ID139908) TaxID=479433 RepID=C7QII5_CATAD|nr:diguanylate cyclase [Catenulispora acidiphila]ACU75062.1 diguanylate cyclase [Catenulispora acidiphila DSM 44928]